MEWGGWFLVGRILFAWLFIFSGINHWLQAGPMTEYAKAKKIPAARTAVLLSGLIILLGGLSILLGLWPRIGAGLIGLFLLGATPTMHNYWAQTDPLARANDRAHFWKNVALLGAALTILYADAYLPHPWPYSLGR